MHSGSVSHAVRLKDKENEYTKVDKIFNNLENMNLIDLMISKDEIFSNKEEANEILNYINLIFSNKIKNDIKYVECMNLVEDTKNRLDKNNNYDMTIDNFYMTLWEELNGKYNRS